MLSDICLIKYSLGIFSPVGVYLKGLLLLILDGKFIILSSLVSNNGERRHLTVIQVM